MYDKPTGTNRTLKLSNLTHPFYCMTILQEQTTNKTIYSTVFLQEQKT